MIEFATEKWGGRPHYRGQVRVLGHDTFGTWLWGPEGRVVEKGDGTSFVTEHPVLILVPPDEWWTLAWFVGHPELDLYVNISTPAERRKGGLVCIDLDLDVIRFTDGRAEIVDRDEFEEHQRRYGYPADVIAAAERATAEALDLVKAGEPPFCGTAAEGWLAVAGQA